MKTSLSNRITLIESFITYLPLLGYQIIQIKNTSPELLINIVFIILLIILLIFRNNSNRHMYFGFVLLIMSVIGDIFGYQQFTYVASSLALSLFILGIINMLLFKIKNQSS